MDKISDKNRTDRGENEWKLKIICGFMAGRRR